MMPKPGQSSEKIETVPYGAVVCGVLYAVELQNSTVCSYEALQNKKMEIVPWLCKQLCAVKL